MTQPSQITLPAHGQARRLFLLSRVARALPPFAELIQQLGITAPLLQATLERLTPLLRAD